MKVLVIFPDRLDKPVGGLSIVAQKIKEYLSDEISFTFVGQPQEVKMDNYVNSSLPLRINHGGIGTILGQTSYLFDAIRQEKPDIIHAFDWSVYMAGVYASKFFNIPLVCSMQLSIVELEKSGITYNSNQNSPDGYWISESLKQIEAFGLQQADKVIHVSNGYANRFQQYKSKEVIISNGIDVKDYDVTPANIKTERRLKVAYIGRFALMQNVFELINSKIPNDIDLFYVGERAGGEDWIFESMLNQSKENDNVHYMGGMFGDKKHSFLNAMDAVIFPSIHEPFGLVGLEAFASNSVLLTSHVDGISDYANTENSIHCGTDRKSISLALDYLTRLSDNELEQYKNKGLVTAGIFSWESSVNKYKEVYKSVIR